jgi:hypothetical protein
MTEAITSDGAVVTVTEIDRMLWAPTVFTKSSVNGKTAPKLITTQKQGGTPAPAPSGAEPPRPKKGKEFSGPRIRNDLNSCFSNPTFWALVVLAIAGLLAIRYGVEDGSQ